MDELSAYEALRFLVPKVPAVFLAAATHLTGYDESSRVWDLKTAIIMSLMRSANPMLDPSPMSVVQARTLRDSGPKGKVWAAPGTIPATKVGAGVRETVLRVVDELRSGSGEYVRPESVDLRFEWVGYRTGAGPKDRLPTGLTERERYDSLMTDPARKGKATLLYFHGGAYYLCGFGTHRQWASILAKASAGRAFLVEYRLAPQAAFPAQVIDAFHSYLYLLYPPEGSLHEPVPASEIVIAGDSAGGHMALGLLQLLLHLHRTNKVPTRNPTVHYNGKEVEVPLPAGVATFSAWTDVSVSSPSYVSNAKYDYIAAQKQRGAVLGHEPDEIWPTKPPRADIFTVADFLDHPLVALMTADWTGSPPLFMMAGDECLYDENSVTALRARQQGVVLQWEHYQGMPHCFSQLFAYLETAKCNVRNVGQFVSDCIAGKVVESTSYIHALTGKVDKIELADESKLSFDRVIENVQAAKKKRLDAYGSGTGADSTK